MSILATAFLSFSWYLSAFFIFIAFVPLFELERFLSSKNLKQHLLHFFLFCYLSFFLWNILVVFWITGIEFWGGAIVLVLNPLFMTVPFLLFGFIKKNLGKNYSYFAFIAVWISYEYIHHHWFLAFPWLSLGNVFGTAVFFVQWYEYTGVLGGTLWVLLVNIFIFIAWQEESKWYWLFAGLSFLIPAFLSWYIWSRDFDLERSKVEIVVVQPNFHPTEEKLKTGNRFVKFTKQIEIVHQLAEEKITDNTDLLLLPESALDDFFERYLINKGNQVEVNQLTSILEKHPKLSLITGLTTFSYVNRDSVPSYTARYSKEFDFHYDVYNSAVFFKKNQKPEFYSKSKLVAGGEYMPLKWLIGNWSINAGGTSGEVTPQEERVVFEIKNKVKYAPIICYESVFGEYVSEYIEKGANILCVITNDGYWDGTPEPWQHFNIDRLRCIEQRRHMARAAYTGISGFINHRGEIIQSSQNQERIALKASLIPMEGKTFYQRHGDYLGSLAIIGVIVLVITGFVRKKQLL